MVSIEFALADLRSQFPGQFVLYGADLAKILGRSDRALEHLIDRDRLHFKVKTVGGRHCVDIYQVAQWLATDKDEVQIPVQQDAWPKVRRPKPWPVASHGATTPNIGWPTRLTGNMAGALLSARKSRADAMERFLCGLTDRDELAFMGEVLEEMLFGPESIESAYLVTIRKLYPSGSKRIAQESLHYFANEEDACVFLLHKISQTDSLKRKSATHYCLDHSAQRVFQAVLTKEGWIEVINPIGLSYGG